MTSEERLFARAFWRAASEVMKDPGMQKGFDKWEKDRQERGVSHATNVKHATFAECPREWGIWTV